MNYLLFILMYIFLIPTIYFNYISSSLYPIFKTITSLCFLFCGYLTYKGANTNSPYSICLLIGLFLGMIGDILLTLKKLKFFILGGISFTIGHMFYTRAFLYLAPLHLVIIAIITLCFILFLVFIFKIKILNISKLRSFIIIYSLVIFTMLATALNQFSFTNHNKLKATLILLGAALFTASDFILLFNKFYSKCPKIFNILNLISYYSAQILFALSIEF